MGYAIVASHSAMKRAEFSLLCNDPWVAEDSRWIHAA